MKVRELIEKLQAMPPDSDVLFDTEAARFNVHMVAVDSAWHDDEPHPHCGLHTKEPREYTGTMDRKLAALVEATARWYAVQRGTMAAQSPSGLAVAAALKALAE